MSPTSYQAAPSRVKNSGIVPRPELIKAYAALSMEMAGGCKSSPKARQKYSYANNVTYHYLAKFGFFVGDSLFVSKLFVSKLFVSKLFESKLFERAIEKIRLTKRNRKSKALPIDLFVRTSMVVARELIGKILVVTDLATQQKWLGRIVETEAYQPDEILVTSRDGITEIEPFKPWRFIWVRSYVRKSCETKSPCAEKTLVDAGIRIAFASGVKDSKDNQCGESGNRPIH
jgi:hypothetical protein